MKILRKTILALCMVGLLKIIMLVLDKYSPTSGVFHNHFLFSFQLLVLLWLLLSIIFYLFKIGNSWVARFLPVLMALLVLGTDMLFNYLMDHPSRIPSFARKTFKDYYTTYERNIIQYEPCMIYDSAFFYKFIPGLRFTFGNIEYKNQYAVNSESLRDDESSLMGPQVICIGDSYTLGWGVEQNQSFPEMLGAQCSKIVLNTGNSSYGTVRELKRLSNCDTSDLEYLVIQYCRNDVGENVSFIQNNGVLPISSESEYQRAKTEYKWKKEYFPGKYSVTISYEFLKSKLRKLIKGSKKPYYLSEDPIASAGYFIQVLDKFKLNRKFKVLVTDINDLDEMQSGFLPAVDSLLQQPQYSHLKGSIKTVDVSGVLEPSDYYLLDAHIRPSGHEKIARKLAENIN